MAYVGQHFPVFLTQQRTSRRPATVLRYIAGVHSSGRYCIDQNGNPILVRGASHWGAMQQITSTADITTLYQHLGAYGVNACIVDTVGAAGVGGTDDGLTADSIAPFVGGDIKVFNSTYWARMDLHVQAARDNGITLWLIPMDYYATGITGTAFNGKSTSDCQTYGTNLANRYPTAQYPNIVWFLGNDYPETTPINSQFSACLTGIRSTGDNRPVTVMLAGSVSASTDSTTWEQYATINCNYTYPPQYAKLLGSYRRTAGARDPRPALMTEARYEGDTWFTVSGEPSPNTEEIRRQSLWSLTSGSPGEFIGDNDWRLASGWQSRLTTYPGKNQMRKVRDWFESLPWTTLVPDDLAAIVTAGRGTFNANGEPFQNDYVTACYNAAGTCAVIYIPTNSGVSARTVTIDGTKMQAGFTATWVDPTEATNRFTATPSGSNYTDPGTHADGYRDWILWLHT